MENYFSSPSSFRLDLKSIGWVFWRRLEWSYFQSFPFLTIRKMSGFESQISSQAVGGFGASKLKNFLVVYTLEDSEWEMHRDRNRQRKARGHSHVGPCPLSFLSTCLSVHTGFPSLQIPTHARSCLSTHPARACAGNHQPGRQGQPSLLLP